MKCLICKHSETSSGSATVTLEREGITVVFKSVPAAVCDNCGEEYVDEETASRLLDTFEQAVRAGILVDVRDYSAA